jgi:hypothetical protein
MVENKILAIRKWWRNKMNIGLLAGNRLSDFRLQTLRPILEDESFSIKLAIIDNRPKKSIKQKIIRNFRRGRGGYILVMAFNWYFEKKDNGISVKAFCREPGIALIETQNLYEPETLALIKKYQLDVLLLMGGFGIIKDALINITPKGILSYHHGDMRKYRACLPVCGNYTTMKRIWVLRYNGLRQGWIVASPL